MPTSTYKPIANITLSSSAGEVNFTNITQQYRDLVIVINATASDGNRIVLMGMNDDNSSAVLWTAMTGNGSSMLSQNADWVQLYTTYGYENLTTTPSVITINVMDYSATDKHKTFLVRSSNSSNSVSALAGRQASNNAITKFRIYPNGSTFAAGSSFAIYGIGA